MSHQLRFIVVLLAVIGILSSTTRSFARIIHCGSVSLKVPDAWKACYEEHLGNEVSSDGGKELLGTWEAFTGGESHGYLTVGISKRFSSITPAKSLRTRRELERHLHDLPRVEEARVTSFDLVLVDGLPSYRAHYVLETTQHDVIEQWLYIVGARQSCFFSFTRTALCPLQSDCQFDEIMRRARVGERPPLLYTVSRELSLGLLSLFAGTSFLCQRLAAGARKKYRAIHGGNPGDD